MRSGSTLAWTWCVTLARRWARSQEGERVAGNSVHNAPRKLLLYARALRFLQRRNPFKLHVSPRIMLFIGTQEIMADPTRRIIG